MIVIYARAGRRRLGLPDGAGVTHLIGLIFMVSGIMRRVFR